MAQISSVQIYKVSNNGSVIGPANAWRYRPGNAGNPAVPCQSPLERLDFYESAHGWRCRRADQRRNA